MLVEGWECSSCIFLMHTVVCRVIEHCSRFANVQERKLVEGCLLLLNDPLSLQAGGYNTVCCAKRGSIKMQGWSGLVIFYLH